MFPSILKRTWVRAFNLAVLGCLLSTAPLRAEDDLIPELDELQAPSDQGSPAPDSIPMPASTPSLQPVPADPVPEALDTSQEIDEPMPDLGPEARKGMMAYETDPRVPAYQRARPGWSFALFGNLKQFLPAESYGLGFEWLPRPVQKYGVLSLGLSLMKHTPKNGAGIEEKFFDFVSATVGLKYQLRYFREQPIVPFVGLEYHYFSFKPMAKNRDSETVFAPVFGAMLLLNFLDSNGASSFYQDVGVIRTYITFEMRSLAATTKLAFTKPSYTLGLRFEF